MSTAIARNFQIGIDPTPTNNFTLYQPATPDGTLRLGNGNTGITSSLLTLTSAGSLNFGGTAVRITGDFSNATLANRVYFQNSTSAQTALGVLPGSGFAIAAANIFSQSDPANSALLQMRIENTVDARISSGVTGTGSFVPMTFYTGGSERMRLDTSGNLGVGTSSPATRLDVNGTATTTALTVNGNNISAVNSLGFRNRIINGDMRIDQRNNGASVSPVNAYTVDRWQVNVSQTGRLTAQQNAGSVTPPAGFTNYLGITSSSAYSILTSDQFILQQQIEGFNVADLGWGAAGAQSVTLSFWVRSSLTGTFGGSFQNNAYNRSYPFTFTISSANTWEYKTVVVAGDTTGTWTTNNTAGIRVAFGLGVGSTLSASAGAWQAGNFSSATGATSVVGTNGATFYITGVQLEAGSVATPFERRDYGRELIMCQRYFQFWKSGWSGVSGGFGYQYSDGVNFCVPTRVAPTLALTSWTTGARFPQASWFTANVGVEGFLSVATANAAGGNDNWLATGTASAEL